MSDKISRRDFLKLAGVGAATTAVLTGCGPAARLVQREPYTKMPEYTYNGLSTYYATTCRECSAGCGLIARTYQGRAIKSGRQPEQSGQSWQDVRARSGDFGRTLTIPSVCAARSNIRVDKVYMAPIIGT